MRSNNHELIPPETDAELVQMLKDLTTEQRRRVKIHTLRLLRAAEGKKPYRYNQTPRVVRGGAL